MIIIWLIVYLVEGCPDIFNNNGSDSAWIVTGIICLLLPLPLTGRDRGWFD